MNKKLELRHIFDSGFKLSVNDIRICFIGVAAYLVIKDAEYISTGIIWCKSNVAYAYIDL